MTAIHLPVAAVHAAPDHPRKAAAAAKRADPPPADGARPSKPAADTYTPTSPSQPGVLRLLEQGHFKGVADVRLRINFADQLAQRQTQAQQTAAQTQLGDLAGQVQDQVAGLLEAPELSEEQTAAIAEAGEAFTAAVQTVRASAAEGSALDPEAVAGDVQAAFDNLVGGLEMILAGPATDEAAPSEIDHSASATEESATEGPGPVDAPAQDAPTDGPSPHLEDLKAIFDAALATLRESLLATDTLPPLSEPSGQGAAYAKFLAIYQQRQAEAAGTNAASMLNEPAVDVVA